MTQPVIPRGMCCAGRPPLVDTAKIFAEYLDVGQRGQYSTSSGGPQSSFGKGRQMMRMRLKNEVARVRASSSDRMAW